MPQIDKIQLRRGESTHWTAVNPTLDAGEQGYETDTRRIKIGDGVTPWVSLDYANTVSVHLRAGSSKAAANAAAITAALAISPVVEIVAEAGQVCNPFRVPSSRQLVIRAGSTLKRADSVNAPLISNKYSGQRNYATRFNRASNVVTVANRYHGLTVGQTVWIGGLTDTTMHGIQTVASVPSEHTWTYASAGSNGAGGASTIFGAIIPLRRTLAGSAFVAASNIVTVTDPGHDLRPGMNVWTGTVGASTSFVGILEVLAVTADTWQYITTAAGTGTATGTIAISYDSDIVVTGDGTLDGNATNNSTVQDLDLMLSLVHFGMLNQSEFSVRRAGGTIFRIINAFNVADFKWRDTEVYDTLVGIQYEASAIRTVTERIGGGTSEWTTGAQQYDDMVAFVGTKHIGGQLYDSTVSPYGLGNFLDNHVSTIYAPTCLNAVKLTADVSCYIDNLVCEDITGGATNFNTTPYGGAGIRFCDDGLGQRAMTCGRLYVRRVKWTGGSNAVQWSSSGSCVLFDVDGVEFVQTAAAVAAGGANIGFPVNITSINAATGSIKTLNVSNVAYSLPSGVVNKPALVFGSGNVRTTNTISIEQLNLDKLDLTVGNNASGASILKYGNCNIGTATVSRSVFRGPVSGTGHAIACNGPASMGRWVLDRVRTVAGGTALGLVFTVINADASDTAAAGEIVFSACDLTATSGIYDNNSNWTGTLTVRMCAGTKATFTGNLLNLGAATGLTVLHGDGSVSTTADKVAGTLAGTLRVNGRSFQLDGDKVTAPQPGDMFWNTDSGMTGSASVGMKARTAAGAWAALF